jgi:hypothetical protein
MFDTNCTWEIDWQKIDLTDGFWQMIISTGAEHNFAFQTPTRPQDKDTFYVVPSSLQFGVEKQPSLFLGSNADHSRTHPAHPCPHH